MRKRKHRVTNTNTMMIDKDKKARRKAHIMGLC